MTKQDQYYSFLQSKILEVQPSGFEVDKDNLSPIAFPHQKDVAAWAIHGGCRAIFCSFGLGKKHVCPFQFDIVDRALVRYSNPGDVVYDPFGGLMTVPYRCITLGRYGLATELNEISFKDGVRYCREAAYKKSVPTLFQLEKIA